MASPTVAVSTDGLAAGGTISGEFAGLRCAGAGVRIVLSPPRTMRIRALFVASVVVFACSASAFAQQPPAAPTPPPPPQEGTAEFSFVGTTGNTSTQAFGVGGEYTVRRNPWLYNARAAYIRNETDNELKAESFAALFRASRTLGDRLSAFGRYAYLHNEFSGIDHRNAIAGGLEYALLRFVPQQLAVWAGVGYANEQRVAVEDLSTAEFLSGASYKWTISPTADLTDDYEFNVSFDDAGDWRHVNLLSLTARMTTMLSLKLSNTVRYVHQPVPGFDSTDTITSFALVASF